MTTQHPGPNSGSTPRREPPLGRFDELQFNQARPDPQHVSRTHAMAEWVRGWDWRWIAAVAVVVIALLLLRQPLANWLWPETRAGRLRQEAARALVEGRLTAADGSGARELYTAIARRQFAQAHAALQLADELSVPRAQAAALREQLRRNEAASVGIGDLLEQAAAARAAGKLEGSDGALPLYQRVLELQPDLTQALEGREDTLSDLLQQARGRLEAGDLAAAAVIVLRVQAADAGHVELPDALAALARAAETRRREADRQLRSGQLAKALEGYDAALLVDPEDADAMRGARAVASAHAQRSERFSADYRFDEAEAELQQARSVMGQSTAQVPAIAEAQQHLTRARQLQRQVSASAPTPSQRRRLAQLLAEAAQAQARGDLITPPGDSAFDKLGAARAIAPQDRRVHAASARLVPAAVACFNDALRGNRLVRAGACLDARRALEGDNAGVRAGRSELAQRWIALGDQRLSAGEVKGAQAAAEAARALDPDAEGLAVFTERLRAASMAADAEGERR
jgi:tetratricopeptide (TPR) repeat protein